MKHLRSSSVRLATVAAVAGLTLVAGCSSSGSDKPPAASPGSTTPVSTQGSTGGGLAPLKDGTLKIGTSADFPPMMLRDPDDPSKVKGFEADMVKAIMDHIGQKYTISISSFGGLIPAIQASQLDLVVSDVYVTADRQKVVDFVPYLESGLSILVAAKNASNAKTYLDLCGKKMGVVTGSPSETEAANRGSKQCTDAGKPAIQVSSFQAVSDELPQIDNGRIFGIIEDSLSLAYVQQQKPGVYAVGFVDPDTRIKVGFVLAKGSPMESALQKAVDWYLASDQYKTDAKNWGIPETSLLSPSS